MQIGRILQNYLIYVHQIYLAKLFTGLLIIIGLNLLSTEGFFNTYSLFIRIRLSFDQMILYNIFIRALSHRHFHEFLCGDLNIDGALRTQVITKRHTRPHNMHFFRQMLNLNVISK